MVTLILPLDDLTELRSELAGQLALAQQQLVLSRSRVDQHPEDESLVWLLDQTRSRLKRLTRLQQLLEPGGIASSDAGDECRCPECTS